MRRRWIAILGACLLAITILGDVARGLEPSDSGPELRRSLDDSSGAILLASAPRAPAAFEPPAGDGRPPFRHAARLGFASERRVRLEPASLAVSHRSPFPFRPLRYAPRAVDASTDPH